MGNTVIELNNVNKKYVLKNETITALDNINLSFEKGKFYAIMGHSGSGKSTLIKVIGLLDKIDSGIYKINGKETKELNSLEEALIRRDNIGLIFQDFFLDEHLKAYENVILPMLINDNIPKDKRKEFALELLKIVDLSERVEHYPRELSGGEQQRVAIARALANNPTIILADEPTGNLDEDNEKLIFKILKILSKQGKCVIVVSHSNEIKEYADVIYNIRKGRLEVSDEIK